MRFTFVYFAVKTSLSSAAVIVPITFTIREVSALWQLFLSPYSGR